MTQDAVAFSPYHTYLFKKACRKGTEKDTTIRVNVVGNCGQGKTSLTRRLLGNTCFDVESTNGIDIHRYRFKSSTSGKVSLDMIEDEHEDYINRIAAAARSIDVKPGVLELASKSDVTKEFLVQKSSEETDEYKSHELNYNKEGVADTVGSVNIPKLSTQEIKSFTTKIDGEQHSFDVVFDFWDFGGQYTFYATHTLFHSRKALYLLVFDLSSPLDKVVKDEEFPGKAADRTMEFYARFWMESIHYFVGPEPPVFLVGTHVDKLNGDQQTKLDSKDKFFEQVRSLFDNTDMKYHIQSEDFAVNNHDASDKDFAELLLVILNKRLELGKASRIPVRWITLEKSLNQEKHKKIIPFTRLREINMQSDYPLSGDEELKLFLQYHHEKGSFMYFDEDQISEHVVLDPRYVVDAFRCIITTKEFRLKDISIREAWRSLINEGKLTDTLIEKVWSTNFIEHKHILLAYLKKHNIISQIAEYDEKSGTCTEQDWYVIPSLLKDHAEEQDNSMCEFLEGKSRTQIRYLMQFEKPNVVRIVYHRLLATALGKWPVVSFGKRKLLFQTMCVLKLTGTYAGIAELRNSSIELQVCNLASKTVECSVSDSFRRFAESVVTHEFRKLKYQLDDKVKPYVLKYRCNHIVHGVEGSHSVSDISQLEAPFDAVFCPDNYTHENLDCGKAIAEWFIGRQVEMNFPKTVLSDKALSSIAQSAIGRNWEFLGLQFGINQASIDHIKADNDTEDMRIYKMLLKWKETGVQFGKDATLDELSKALHRCSKVYVDWDEMRNIRDRLQENASMPRLDLKSANKDVCQVAERECTGNTDEQTPVEFIRGLKNQHVKDKLRIVTFKCELTMAAQVQWYRNNHKISPSTKYDILDKGHIHRLKIIDVCDSDEGKYCVKVDGQKSEASLIIEDTDEERALLKLAITEAQRFEVEVNHSDYARLCGIQGKMTLVLGNDSIAFEETETEEVEYNFLFPWIKLLEIQTKSQFEFEVAGKCPNGAGKIIIETASATAIHRLIQQRILDKTGIKDTEEETTNQETFSSVDEAPPLPFRRPNQRKFSDDLVPNQLERHKKPMTLPRQGGTLRTGGKGSGNDENKIPKLPDN